MAEKKPSLFRVGIKHPNEKQPREHLVRAHTRQQAIDAVTVGMVAAEVADPDDIYRLAKDGVVITDATVKLQDPGDTKK